jgi:hypothetical protein
MSMFNLTDATKLYQLLKDYLYKPVENEAADVYAYSIARMIQQKDARVFFEILSIGTNKSPEDFLKGKPDNLFRDFLSILIDNKIMSLKSFFEDV